VSVKAVRDFRVLYCHLLIVYYPALLKSISERIIPGIPENLRILLVDQIESNTALLDSSKDLSVTEKVVRSDRRREGLLAEQQGEVLSERMLL
jgi:ATP-binding cassette, subfamily F, member 3